MLLSPHQSQYILNSTPLTYTCICVSIRQVALGVVIRTGTVIASNGVVTHTTFLIVTNTHSLISVLGEGLLCVCGVMVSVV